jgi:hypothetical protein
MDLSLHNLTLIQLPLFKKVHFLGQIKYLASLGTLVCLVFLLLLPSIGVSVSISAKCTASLRPYQPTALSCLSSTQKALKCVSSACLRVFPSSSPSVPPSTTPCSPEWLSPLVNFHLGHVHALPYQLLYNAHSSFEFDHWLEDFFEDTGLELQDSSDNYIFGLIDFVPSHFSLASAGYHFSVHCDLSCMVNIGNWRVRRTLHRSCAKQLLTLSPVTHPSEAVTDPASPSTVPSISTLASPLVSDFIDTFNQAESAKVTFPVFMHASSWYGFDVGTVYVDLFDHQYSLVPTNSASCSTHSISNCPISQLFSRSDKKSLLT